MTNMSEKIEMVYDTPSLSRWFPSELDYMLPLRYSMKQYKANRGRVTTSNESPESDGEGISDGRMFTMAIFPPIVGHGVFVNGVLSVCESTYMEVYDNQMSTSVSNLPVNSLKWLIGEDPNDVYPTQVENDTMLAKASVVYTGGGPLCAYDNHAVTEAANHSTNNNFWRSLYPNLEDVECNYGPIGLMHDNSVVSLGSAAGDDIEPNIDERMPKKVQDGFLDACYTPSSKASGKVRALAFSVQKRVKTTRTMQIASELLSVLKSGPAFVVKDWVVRCEGVCCVTSINCVKVMIEKWTRYCEVCMPVLHVFRDEKVVVVSTAQGVLIRPVRWNVVKNSKTNRYDVKFEGPYVDTMAVHSCDTMKMANIKFPTREGEPEQYFCSIAQCIPFGAWTADPRLNLGVQMLRQGMSLSPIKGDATMVSLGENKPLVTTPFATLIMDKSTTNNPLVMPGKNVVTAFVNRTLNTEDACVVSKELAESGMFAWSGYINYPLPKNVGYIRVGMVVKDQYWWAPAVEGVVVDIKMSKVGDSIAIIHIASTTLGVGDKLGTSHGLKFTVGELLPYEVTVTNVVPQDEMPSITDEITGTLFKPNLLISTKNLARGLGGQLREMTVATSMFSSIQAFRTSDMYKSKNPTVLSFEDQKKVTPRLPSGSLVVNGKELVITDTNGEKRTVRATYGIMRVLQLRHIAALKHHYPSSTFKSINVARGRYRLGTPRLSEGELLALIMQNCTTNVRDAIVTNDLVVFTSCTGCHSTIVSCDCPFPKPPSIEKQTRYSLLLMSLFTELYMLNTPETTKVSLRFFTRT